MRSAHSTQMAVGLIVLSVIVPARADYHLFGLRIRGWTAHQTVGSRARPSSGVFPIVAPPRTCITFRTCLRPTSSPEGLTESDPPLLGNMVRTRR